jgi:hypothetical protein
MLSPQTLLRQRYSLSFLTTTLLIALTAESSLAFSINTLKSVTPGLWDTEESYTLGDQSRGTTRLSPTDVISITRGGTIGFLGTLRRDFPTWNFNFASNDLEGSFEIAAYDARGTQSLVGAELILFYQPGAGDPTPQNNKLNWIQRVVDNHNITNNEGHGNYEDVIDIPAGRNNPFYNGTFLSPSQRNFEDFSRRNDPNRDHNWLAQLYLVEETGSQQVTIYNGIQWGWENRVQPVPEPLTIFAAGVSLGFGALFKKTVKGTKNKIK